MDAPKTWIDARSPRVPPGCTFDRMSRFVLLRPGVDSVSGSRLPLEHYGRTGRKGIARRIVFETRSKTIYSYDRANEGRAQLIRVKTRRRGGAVTRNEASTAFRIAVLQIFIQRAVDLIPCAFDDSSKFLRWLRQIGFHNNSAAG
jgi:hypothetical protein